MPERFDYEFYCGLLQRLQKTHLNLCFSEVCHASSTENYYILRHDVDFSPDAALDMAKREAEMGVRASYFLLFASPFYNLLSAPHRDFPRQLADLGHEVGLHYDVRAYAQLGQPSLLDSLFMEAELLGRLSGTEVKSIAMHNPSIYGEDPFRNVQQFTNAYADEFTKEIAYLSDSCGAWRDSTVLALRESIPTRFQLLIHPLFWSEAHADRWARLESLLNAKVRELTDFAEWTHALWLQSAGVEQHERRNQRSQQG
jgi:hypothetical protein